MKRPTRVGIVAVACFATIGTVNRPRAAQAVARAARGAATSAATSAAVAPTLRRDSLLVSVLTMGPGPEIYDKFGHISLRFRDVTSGADVAFNWGMFDFDQPHFLVNFITGETRYWMEGLKTGPLIDYYRRAGRRVSEQVLDLDPAQADSLLHFIQWNALEANKWYRYDYYRDNCATRVRDALDGVLRGAIRRGVATHEHGVTYRSETTRLAAPHAFLNVAMTFALGRKADATLSAWEEMYIPMRLAELLQDVRVPRTGRTPIPLVRSETTLVAADRFRERSDPPNLLLPLLSVGLGLAAMFLALGAAAGRSRLARLTVVVAAGLWHLVIGAAGVLVLYLGLFTHHAYMAQNASVLLGTPASLALALLIPFSLRAHSRRVSSAVRVLSIFCAVCGAVALLAVLTPPLAQRSVAVFALILPSHVALNAIFASWRSRG